MNNSAPTCPTPPAKTNAAVIEGEGPLCKLSNLRNALAPINAKLPREMLCEIFLYLAHGFYESGLELGNDNADDGTKALTPYSWVPQINLCRHWRQTAIQFPRLWSLITIRTYQQLLCVIQRSAQVPLTIKSPPSKVRNPLLLDVDLFLLLLGRIGQVQHLELATKSSLWDHALRLPLQAPLLEYLHLECFGPDLENSPAVKPDLPSLHCLELIFPLPGLLKSMLTLSSVSRLTVTSPITRLPPSVWLTTLREFQSLGYLHLRNVFSEADPAAPTNLPRVTFPYLALLCLGEATDTAAPAVFLQNIAIPPSSDINYDGCGLDTYEGNYGTIVDALDMVTSVRRHCEPPQPFRTFRARKTIHPQAKGYASAEPDFLIIELWETRFSVDELNPSCEIREEPSMALLVRATVVAYLALNVFVKKFYLSQLNVLHVSDVEIEFMCEYDIWHTLHELRELSIEPGVYYMVDVVCNLDYVLEPTDPASGPSLPRLETLVLRSVPCYFHRTGMNKPGCTYWMADLFKALKARRDKGAPLRRLCLVNGVNTESEFMESFGRKAKEEGVFEVFEWDGNGGDDDDHNHDCENPNDCQWLAAFDEEGNMNVVSTHHTPMSTSR